MSRRKLLILDQPYHAQTRSSDFAIELLSTRFDVTVDYLQAHPSDIDATVSQVQSHSPDLLVLWQVILRSRALIRLGLPVTWAPMFDQSRRPWHQNYLEAAQAGVNVLAFSQVVGRFARSWNLPCLDVQYYPPPSPDPRFDAANNRVLLWYRGFIQPHEVWPTLCDIPNLQVVLKNDLDPGSGAGKRDDGLVGDHLEQIIEGFLPRGEYDELVNSCGVFVAPRRKEGIGLSFLEAMARGSCVVAYDAPTMNEYIEHGKTGWLFDERSAKALNSDAVPSIRQAAYHQVISGRARWEQQKQLVLDFIDSAPVPRQRRGGKLLVASPLASTISALTPLKHKLFGK